MDRLSLSLRPFRRSEATVVLCIRRARAKTAPMTQRHALIALPILLLAACGPVEKKADEAGTAPPPAEPGQSGASSSR
jgi:hypothetical protein